MDSPVGHRPGISPLRLCLQMVVELSWYRSFILSIWSEDSPAVWRAVKRAAWGTLPKAFAKSSQAIQMSPPLHRASSSRSCSRKLCSKQPSDVVNPFWASESSLLSEAHLERRFEMRLQRILPAVSDWAIGLQLLISFVGPFLWMRIVVEDFQAGWKRLLVRHMLMAAARTWPPRVPDTVWAWGGV